MAEESQAQNPVEEKAANAAKELKVSGFGYETPFQKDGKFAYPVRIILKNSDKKDS